VTDAVAGLAAAYGASADAWAGGPSRIYDVLADELVARSPAALAGRLLLDVGAGRGAAGRAVARAGGRSVAVDVAEGMVAATAGADGTPGVVADGRRLPVGDRRVDGVVAAFSFNHLADPSRALAEAARVTRPGGVVLASAYADDDDHPVKAAVDGAATAAGWRPEPWTAALRVDAVPRLATVARADEAARAAGLAADVVKVERAFPELGPADLVSWRLGMATVAPFLAGLDPDTRRGVAADALERLGDPPPLVRRMVVIAAIVA
jgi:SAM-dependent methyltransferase